MSFWRACRLWPACPETHKHLFLYVHFVFSPLATWCMHGTGNGHARQERPASSPNRPGMQSSLFKLETRMGPTSAMKALQGNGENEQKLLIPEGLGQSPLWPGLGPRPHSCFDVFKHMNVPMLSKPMTYSPEDESFYLSNTKRNYKNLSLETEKTKLSMVSVFCPPGPCSSWRNQRGTPRWMVSGHGILGTLHPQVQLPGGMHEVRNCRVQSKMSPVLLQAPTLSSLEGTNRKETPTHLYWRITAQMGYGF